MLCGRSPQWAHHRNAGRNQRRDHLGLLDAPFELHRLAAGLLENAARVFDGLVFAKLEAGERHIDHDQGVAHRPAHHFGVVNHLLQRDRQRGAVPLDDHRQAIADQNALDARRIDQAGHRVIVGRQHGDPPSGRLHGGELGNGDLLVFAIHVCGSPKKPRKTGQFHFRQKPARATVWRLGPPHPSNSPDCAGQGPEKGVW